MAPRTPSRSTRYSVKPRDTADREERRAFAQRKKRKLDTIKAASSRSNMTADKRERVTKKALATAKSGTTYTAYSKKPRTGGAGADTIGARRTRSMLNADMRMAKRIGQADDHLKQYGAWNKDAALTAEIKKAAAKRAETAKKKAAGAKTAAKKQNYR